MDLRESGRATNPEPQEWSGGLILIRKIDQSILASNGANISVLEVERNRVKLGFRCPPELRVLRGELDSTEFVSSSTGKGGGGLLILARSTGQRVNIGDNMTVQVLSIERDRVKIGIKASDEIRVMRAELLTSEELAVFNTTGSLPAKLFPKQIS